MANSYCKRILKKYNFGDKISELNNEIANRLDKTHFFNCLNKRKNKVFYKKRGNRGGGNFQINEKQYVLSLNSVKNTTNYFKKYNSSFIRSTNSFHIVSHPKDLLPIDIKNSNIKIELYGTNILDIQLTVVLFIILLVKLLYLIFYFTNFFIVWY